MRLACWLVDLAVSPIPLHVPFCFVLYVGARFLFTAFRAWIVWLCRCESTRALVCIQLGTKRLQGTEQFVFDHLMTCHLLECWWWFSRLHIHNGRQEAYVPPHLHRTRSEATENSITTRLEQRSWLDSKRAYSTVAQQSHETTSPTPDV
jgi:hypothetical protein